MKNLELEHARIVEHLSNIKTMCIDMREEGLGGDDFEYLYLSARLIPAIKRIFEPCDRKIESRYDLWNTERRARFPKANHSALSSEQCFHTSKGFELVADWNDNYIRDEEKQP